MGRALGSALCTATALALGAPTHAAAQAAPAPTRMWMAAGVGAAGGETIGGGAILVQLAVQREPHQLSLRGLVVGDPFAESSNDNAAELGLLYGRALAGALGHVSLSTGLAFTEVESCSGGDSTCGTVGVPVVAEAALRVLPGLGLGVQAFANVNSRASYAGAVLLLQLGWLPLRE